MRSFRILAAALVFIAVTSVVGVMHGSLTGRWGTPPDMIMAGVKLDELPTRVGNWQLARKVEVEPEVIEMLQCAGSSVRVYENVVTGEEVTVGVMLGPAGPIAVHTPEICYASQDYEVTTPRRRVAVNDTDEMWDLRLRAKGLSAQPVRVLYGWTNNKQWQASKYPRFRFGGHAYLYKLQVAGAAAENDEHDGCRDFLSVYLPALRECMIGYE